MSLKKKREGEKEIVVRRRSKKGHGEAHSGAWKVAFADFTLAMMALFMVLWIINPSKSSAPITAEDPVSNPLMEGMINIFDGFDAPVELEARPSQPEPQPEPKKADATAETADKAAAKKAPAKKAESAAKAADKAPAKKEATKPATACPIAAVTSRRAASAH